MSLTNMNMLMGSRRGFPNIPGLYELHAADDSGNTLITADTFITDAVDLSGNGRTLTSIGMGFEATGSSQSKACWKNTGSVLEYATALITSKVSFFFITQGTNFQMCNTDSVASSNVAAVWFSDTNSPLVTNDASANIAVGNFSASTDWEDNTMRAHCFVYDDTTNIRQWYANGELVQDSGDWSAGTAAGSIELFQVARAGGQADHKTSVIAIYENTLLTQRQIQDLYRYYQLEGIVL